MSLTNPKDFEIFYSLLPKDIRKNVWFFPIRQNEKRPDVPKGTKLHDDVRGGNEAYRLTYYEALNRLKWGSNVGIYGLQGGICFLDLDSKDGKLLASKEFLDALESIPTLTIKTASGGFHKYFLNNGGYPNQTFKNENDEEVWSLRSNWFYVLSPGSYAEFDNDGNKNEDGTYRIIKELPISQFQGFGEFFKKNDGVKKEELKTFSQKTESNDISLEEHDKNLDAKGKKKYKGFPAELRFLGLKYGKS